MRSGQAALLMASLACAAFASVAHADAAAGKATFARVCAECHEAGDFQGEDRGELDATLRSIVAGTTRHKEPFKLTDAQIADVAAYMAGGGK